MEINLTIDGLNTDYSELYSTCSGIALRNGAKLHLTVKGTNTLKAGFGGAGIAVLDGCTLEITGSSTGTLNAIGGNNYGGGAGIGSIGNGNSANSEYRYMTPQGLGDITINGGTINTQGGTWYYYTATVGAAGIGSSEYSGAGSAVQGTTFSDNRYITNITGSVTINGGNVSATGGSSATGIGGGNIGTLKTITITGGNLTANGNIGYSEGKGYSGGKITIGSGAILKCTGSINPFEASTVPDNSYVNADGNLQQAQNVSSVWGKEDLTSGWWVVDKYTEVNNRIIIEDTVNLILNDGVTLKAIDILPITKARGFLACFW